MIGLYDKHPVLVVTGLCDRKPAGTLATFMSLESVPAPAKWLQCAVLSLSAFWRLVCLLSFLLVERDGRALIGRHSLEKQSAGVGVDCSASWCLRGEEMGEN